MRTPNVPSPCVGVCQMDPTDTLCLGCLRTIGEIVDWGRRSDDEKRAVWARIDERRARLERPDLPRRPA